ncbi:hypothetical protein SY2F82_60700 [Streptomyces sp. Y2F8-2]|nr:hypothetical protein SY2F82_60700 [Streptomyces sp. Y2F8-2]
MRGVFSGWWSAASAVPLPTAPATATAAEVTADFCMNSRLFMGLTGIRGSWFLVWRAEKNGTTRVDGSGPYYRAEPGAAHGPVKDVHDRPNWTGM